MTDQPHLSQFIATDKGANLTFVGYSANDAGNILRDFFMFAGFTMESGTPISGLYTTGSAGGRVLLGGFSNRKNTVSVCGQTQRKLTYRSSRSCQVRLEVSLVLFVKEQGGTRSRASSTCSCSSLQKNRANNFLKPLLC